MVGVCSWGLCMCICGICVLSDLCLEVVLYLLCGHVWSTKFVVFCTM